MRDIKSDVPLFVRLDRDDAARLDDAAATTGKSKRWLVTEAVREHLRDGSLVIGRATPRAGAEDVLTLAEAAALLKVDEAAVTEAIASQRLPGRQVGGAWRIPRAALLDWLAEADATTAPDGAGGG